VADVGERDKRLNRFVNFLARTVGSVQAVAAIYTQISSRSAYACGWSTNSLMLNPLRNKRGRCSLLRRRSANAESLSTVRFGF